MEQRLACETFHKGKEGGEGWKNGLIRGESKGARIRGLELGQK